MGLTTSCTVTAYNQRGQYEGKRLSLVSCHNNSVEIQIEGGYMDTIWVDMNELKTAVENIAKTAELDN